MRTSEEDWPSSSTKKGESAEVTMLLGMLRTLENLFFSMPISDDITNKYNFLKESKFRQVGLPFTRISRDLSLSLNPILKKDYGSPTCNESPLSRPSIDPNLELCGALFHHVLELSLRLLECVQNPNHAAAQPLEEMPSALAFQEQLRLARQAPLNESRAYASLSGSSKKRTTLVDLCASLHEELVANVRRIEEGVATLEGTVKSLKNQLSLLAANAALKEKNFAAEITLLQSRLDECQHEASTSAGSKQLPQEPLASVVNEMKQKLKTYYDLHMPKQSTWKKEDVHSDLDELVYTDFVVSHASKLASDNQWLADKLAEFDHENQQLKQTLQTAPTHSAVFHEVLLPPNLVQLPFPRLGSNYYESLCYVLAIRLITHITFLSVHSYLLHTS